MLFQYSVFGLNNELLQTDILTKANQLKDLTLLVQHAEAFESALRDQGKIADTADVSAARMSAYRSQQRRQQPGANFIPRPSSEEDLSVSVVVQRK